MPSQIRSLSNAQREFLAIVLAAGIGGSAANLVDLAQIFTGPDPYSPGPLYYVGVAIFFGMGAALALIFKELSVLCSPTSN